jgi:translation initiation factor 6
LDIIKYDVYSGPNIGLYTAVNDKHIFVPNGFAKTKARKLSSYLEVDTIFTTMANTRLIGAMMVINNQGVLLPNNASKHEYDIIKKATGLNIDVLDSKHNALGNLICANDKGAVVSPMIPKDKIKKIEDVLGVEVIQKKIAGYHQVGVVIVSTMKGGVIHPEADEDDINTISNVLGVNIEPATINGGIPYLHSGILANNHSMVVGTHTTGPEIMMLTRAFSE